MQVPGRELEKFESASGTNVVDGSSRAETVKLRARARPVGAAICERKGQSEDLARKPGSPSPDVAAMPDIPDMQWCFPFRRQQAGASFPVSTKAMGATKLQAITESTRLATSRRIRFRER
jgi:hypothetical protein